MLRGKVLAVSNVLMPATAVDIGLLSHTHTHTHTHTPTYTHTHTHTHTLTLTHTHTHTHTIRHLNMEAQKLTTTEY